MTGWLHSLKRWLRWLYWGVYLDQAMVKEHERFEKRLAAVENGDCQKLVTISDLETAKGAQARENAALKQELAAALDRIAELEKAAKHPPAQRISTPSFRAAVQRGAVEFRPPVGHAG